jgi:ABC-type dipeptide/oligopeptide/nickel transport system permease subunit
MSTITPSIPLTAPSDLPEIPRSLWSDAWRKLSHRPSSMICLTIIALYLLIGLSTFLPIFDRKITDPVADGYHAPSSAKFGLWLGADIQGYPVIWRLLYGTRIALTITIFASILSLGIGVSLGIIAGYFGGWIDEIITWLFTTVSSIPWILLMIAMVYALKGQTFPWLSISHQGLLHYHFKFEWTELDPVVLIILALGLTDWVGICRLIRGEVLKHRDRDYVQAARAAGVGTPRILFRHILPNVFHLVIITFSLGAVGYVQAEVVLTFLGLGITNRPSWGRMIDDAKSELLRGVWWQAVAATVAIGILCLALNLLGDALRDALDPRLRGAD